MDSTSGARAALAVAALVACTSALAGCQGSVSVGDTSPTVSQSALEKSISAQLKQQVGTAPDSIDCPGDLKGKVGTVAKCTLTDSGDTEPVTVKVTSVSGTNVKFDISVGDPSASSSAG